MSNGKGSRPRMVPKVFRAGYEAINWAKKPAKSRDWVCVHCQRSITQAEFTGMRAFTVIHNGKTAAKHSLCGL